MGLPFGCDIAQHPSRSFPEGAKGAQGAGAGVERHLIHLETGPRIAHTS
jgi:hypothetical protein